MVTFRALSRCRKECCHSGAGLPGVGHGAWNALKELSTFVDSRNNDSLTLRDILFRVDLLRLISIQRERERERERETERETESERDREKETEREREREREREQESKRERERVKA